MTLAPRLFFLCGLPLPFRPGRLSFRRAREPLISADFAHRADPWNSRGYLSPGGSFLSLSLPPALLSSSPHLEFLQNSPRAALCSLLESVASRLLFFPSAVLSDGSFISLRPLLLDAAIATVFLAPVTLTRYVCQFSLSIATFVKIRQTTLRLQDKMCDQMRKRWLLQIDGLIRNLRK